MLRVGLTGGIASGKSTILRMFDRAGCHTADADSIVTTLYRPGAAGHQALVSAYGGGILQPSGEIDRGELARIAFSSSDEAKRLNALIHPLVLAEESRMMNEAESSGGDGIYVVEATLLLESGGRERYDRIVVVDVPADIQLERAKGRGLSQTEALRRISHQMAREERLQRADYVIDNSGSESDTREQFSRVMADLRNDLHQKQIAPGPKPRG